MLGLPVAFVHTSAMLFAQQPTLLEKHVGYLASSLLVSRHSELLLMFTNTLRKDIDSTNLVENCIALTQLPHLTTVDMVPVLAPSVLHLLSHSQPMVRKKSVLALKHLHSLDPTLTTPETCRRLAQLLNDSDVGVLSATVAFMHDAVSRNAAALHTAVKPLCAVLRSLSSGQSAKEIIVRGLSAPFLQISIVRLLSALVKSDTRFGSSCPLFCVDVLFSSSELVVSTLVDCLKSLSGRKNTMVQGDSLPTAFTPPLT
jgi:AP-4 complex subunit epsilon-1